MKDHLHKKAMQEVAEKLKNREDAAIRKKIMKTTKSGRFSYATWSGITIWLSSSHDVLTFLIKLPLLRVQEAQPRRSNAAKYTRGYECPWKRFRSSTCSTSLIGFSEKRRNWEQLERRNHCKQYLHFASQWEQGEQVCTTKSLMSMTDNAVGIGTCTQKHENSELMHLQKISWPNGISSWVVNFQTEVCAKAKNLALVLQWIKKIEATISLKEPFNPKSISRKDFVDNEEMDLMMAAELKWCYDIAYLMYEITERRAMTKQKGEKLSHREEDWTMFSAEDSCVLFKKRRL